MGFVTKSSTMTDYKQLFWMAREELNDLSIVGYFTPKGILIEIVKDEMDSQSVNQYVISSKLIKFNRTDIKLEDFTAEDFEHKEGWEDEE